MRYFLLFLIVVSDASTSFETSTPSQTTELPCRTSGCGIHVFRVALSSRPEEKGAVVPVKARKKFGGNVYAPRGKDEHFYVQNVVNEIIQQKPNMDARVKDRIKDHDFVIKPTYGNIMVEGELPKNFQPFESSPPTPSPSPRSRERLDKEFRFSASLIVLLVIFGILVGILLSALAYVIYDYNKQPVVDRSKSIVYTKQSSVEMQPMNRAVYEIGRQPQLPVRSPAQSQSSYRSYRTGRTPLRFKRPQESLVESEA